MDMINLREAPMVDKPAEGATLFALNPDGTINRIKADGIGGGKIAKLRVVTDEGTESAISLQNLRDGVATLANSAQTIVCDNMTYEEAKAVILAGEKLDAMLEVMTNVYATPKIFGGNGLQTLSNDDTRESIGWLFNIFGSYVIVSWTVDGIMMQES